MKANAILDMNLAINLATDIVDGSGANGGNGR
jgi:hypothetical protein